MTLYLKWCQKYDRSKLRSLNLLNKSRTFNFDLGYRKYHRCRIIQYLIGKLSGMVKMIEEGKVVALLPTSSRTSSKVAIYYINRVLLILNLAPLYYRCNQKIAALSFILQFLLVLSKQHGFCRSAPVLKG